MPVNQETERKGALLSLLLRTGVVYPSYRHQEETRWLLHNDTSRVSLEPRAYSWVINISTVSSRGQWKAAITKIRYDHKIFRPSRNEALGHSPSEEL